MTDDWTRRFLAYEFVAYHRPAMARVSERTARELGRGIADWGAVDTFACYVAGPAWREGQIPDAAIRRWSASSDRWWRRAAVVATVALNNRARGGRGDAARTIDICTRVVADRDDMVVKALSWAPRVVREVGNKLVTGLKAGRARNR